MIWDASKAPYQVTIFFSVVFGQLPRSHCGNWALLLWQRGIVFPPGPTIICTHSLIRTCVPSSQFKYVHTQTMVCIICIIIMYVCMYVCNWWLVGDMNVAGEHVWTSVWGLYNFVSDGRFHPRYQIYRITPDVLLSWRWLTSCDCVSVPRTYMYVRAYSSRVKSLGLFWRERNDPSTEGSENPLHMQG